MGDKEDWRVRTGDAPLWKSMDLKILGPLNILATINGADMTDEFSSIEREIWFQYVYGFCSDVVAMYEDMHLTRW